MEEQIKEGKKGFVVYGQIGDHFWDSPYQEELKVSFVYNISQVEKITRMFSGYNRITEEHYGVKLYCPICSDENVHTSGGLVSMWCESGHSWDVILEDWKGNAGIKIENEKETFDNDFGRFTACINNCDYEEAIFLARTARFEHGEQPQF